MKALCERLVAAFEPLVPLAATAGERLGELRRGAANAIAPNDAKRINDGLHAIRTAWRCDDGLVGRPWFRNLYASTDRSSGYAASMLPLAAEALEDRDAAALEAAVVRYERVAQGLREGLGVLSVGFGLTAPEPLREGSGR
jgi:hypothetical protein